MEKKISFYTDGACSGNPGPGGWAVVTVVADDKEHYSVSNGGKSLSTNNEMELTAFVKALESIIHFEQCNEPYNYEIYTDSAYIHNCFKDKWYEYWETHNWRNKSKQEVKNKELWQTIMWHIHAFERMTTEGHKSKLHIYKVEGHSNNEYNNLADKYAVAARKGSIIKNET